MISRQVELMEQEKPTLPEHLNIESPPDYYGIRIARLLVFYAVFCISLCIKQILIYVCLLIITFSVVIGTPDPPTNVSASCDILAMTVSWRSEFNGGDLQTFSVLWWKEVENEKAYSYLVLDPGLHKYTDATIPVTADTRYIITVQATNTHGSVTSGEHVSCKTSKFICFA
jgi:hypothetical protein